MDRTKAYTGCILALARHRVYLQDGTTHGEVDGKVLCTCVPSENFTLIVVYPIPPQTSASRLHLPRLSPCDCEGDTPSATCPPSAARAQPDPDPDISP